MKTFVIALVLIVAGFGVWALWPGSNMVALVSPTPTPTDYVDYSTPTPISSIAVTATSAPTSTPTPKKTPTPTPTLGQGGEGPRPIRTPVFANMVAVNSNQHGVVAVTANQNDLAVISFNTTNNPTNLSQHAYLVNGTCSNIGSVAYSLNPVVNGGSSTTLDVNFLDIARSNTSLAAVIYSPDNMVPYSCGQIR